MILNAFSPDGDLFLMQWDEAVGHLVDVEEDEGRLIFETFILHIEPLVIENLNY